MVAEVTTLYPSNYRDPVATLREIAQRIEDGRCGSVGCVGVVVLGDQLEVFGAGPDSEGPSVVCALQAAASVIQGGFAMEFFPILKILLALVGISALFLIGYVLDHPKRFAARAMPVVKSALVKLHVFKDVRHSLYL